LEARCQGGLLGLEQWSHIWVFYWFDQNDTPEKRFTLQVHPRGNRDNPLTGVFATRSPMRPNLIALSLCRVVSIKGSDIEIESIDAFDQTPVVDIKPYVRGLDRPQGKLNAPKWADP
jgi:tRNA-Thr(GGU) m(6)t(6)A37 methyltransferase TsaA